jgi:hypothetical protein
MDIFQLIGVEGQNSSKLTFAAGRIAGLDGII